MSVTSSTNERLVVTRMLQDRGVDNAAEVVDRALATSDATLAGIRYGIKAWDKKKNVGPGLLVSMALKGGVEAPVPKPKRPAYNLDALPFRFMGHDDWLERRGYPKECPDGSLIVVGGTYPVLEAECDKCGFLTGIPHRAVSEFGLERVLC